MLVLPFSKVTTRKYSMRQVHFAASCIDSWLSDVEYFRDRTFAKGSTEERKSIFVMH